MITKEISKEVRREEIRKHSEIYAKILDKMSTTGMSNLLDISIGEAREIKAEIVSEKEYAWSCKSQELYADCLEVHEDEDEVSLFENQYDNTLIALQHVITNINDDDYECYRNLKVGFGFVINRKNKKINRCSYLIDVNTNEVIDINSLVFDSKVTKDYVQDLKYRAFAILDVQLYKKLIAEGNLENNLDFRELFELEELFVKDKIEKDYPGFVVELDR